MMMPANHHWTIYGIYFLEILIKRSYKMYVRLTHVNTTYKQHPLLYWGMLNMSTYFHINWLILSNNQPLYEESMVIIMNIFSIEVCSFWLYTYIVKITYRCNQAWTKWSQHLTLTNFALILNDITLWVLIQYFSVISGFNFDLLVVCEVFCLTVVGDFWTHKQWNLAVSL